MPAHDLATRKAALADLAAGEGVAATARKFGVDEATVRRWRDQAFGSKAPHATALTPARQADLGEEVFGYLEDCLTTLRHQLVVFGDAAWLKKQNAHDAAILHGVIADKTVRLLAALRSDDERRPGKPGQ